MASPFCFERIFGDRGKLTLECWSLTVKLQRILIPILIEWSETAFLSMM